MRVQHGHRRSLANDGQVQLRLVRRAALARNDFAIAVYLYELIGRQPPLIKSANRDHQAQRVWLTTALKLPLVPSAQPRW